MMQTATTKKHLVSVLAIALALTGITCQQVEHYSPDPGVIEVMLKVKNNRTDLIPFSAVNNFNVLLRSLEAYMPGNLRLDIYSDLSAIRRNPNGDTFNCLSPESRDSVVVLGRAYAPPGTFTELKFSVEPWPVMIIASGFFPSYIEVVQPVPPPPALQQLPLNSQPPLSITVNERRTTRVTVTFDLDSALVRRTETFRYQPFYYVSSVQNF